jgi:hypothetical protein
MYLRILLPFAAGLLLGLADRAAGQDPVRAVLDRAIKAHGGVDKLRKLKACRMKARGKLEEAGGITFTMEYAYQMPKKFRQSMELDVGGQKIKVLAIINGAQLDIEVNGQKLPLDGKTKELLPEEAQLFAQVVRLVSLGDKAYQLSLLAEARVNDQPAVGLRVRKRGMQDIDLYFNKQTGLLAKVQRRTFDGHTEEQIVTAYRQVGGVPVAKHLILKRDGTRYLDMEVLEARFLDRIDDAEFAVAEDPR